jgi:hypothetical protein
MASISQYPTGTEGWRRPSYGEPPQMTNRLPVTNGVEEVNLLVTPFSGIGRMAHVQRQLSTMRGVRRVRIGGLLAQTAHFVVTLEPGTSLSTLVLANTEVVSASASRLELSLKQGGRRPSRSPQPPSA